MQEREDFARMLNDIDILNMEEDEEEEYKRVAKVDSRS
jgi:hypothetical protein